MPIFSTQLSGSVYSHMSGTLSISGSTSAMKAFGHGDSAHALQVTGSAGFNRDLFVSGTLTNSGSLCLSGTLLQTNATGHMMWGHDSSPGSTGHAANDRPTTWLLPGHLQFTRYSNTDYGPSIVFRKYRGGEGSEAMLQDGDTIGKIEWYGRDFNSLTRVARIRVQPDGEWGTGSDTSDSPSKIDFATVPNGESGVEIALTIRQDKTTQFEGIISGSDIQLEDATGASISLGRFESLIEGQGKELGKVEFTAHDNLHAPRTLAKIQAEVADDVFDINADAPTRMAFYITPNSSGTPVGRMLLTDTGDLQITGSLTVRGNTIKAADDGVALSWDNNSNVTVAGDLGVGGDNIKDSGGSAGITFDGSGNTTVDGTLTIGGNEIWGPENQQLKLFSDQDVVVKIDADSTGDCKFKVNIAGDNTKFEVDESGNTRAIGTMRIDGNQILASDGGTAISFDTSDNVTVGNYLTVGGNKIKASDGGNTITLTDEDNVTIGNHLYVAADLHVSGGDIEVRKTAAASANIKLERYDSSLALGADIGAMRFYATENQTDVSQMGYILVECDQAFNWAASETGARMKFGLTANNTRDTPINRMELDNAGNLQIDGDLTISGNDIFDSSSANILSFDGSGNIDAIAQINDDVVIGGNTPMLTIGDGGAENTGLILDAGVGDWRVVANHTDPRLEIGAGGFASTGNTALGLAISGSGVVQPGMGFDRSTAVWTNKWFGKSPDANQWIKFAETPVGNPVTMDKLMKSTFIVTMVPWQTSNGRAGRNTFKIQASWAPKDAAGGCYTDPEITEILCDAYDGTPGNGETKGGLLGFDPDHDIRMLILSPSNAAAPTHSELWIRCKAPQCDIFVQALDSTGTKSNNDASSATQPGWVAVAEKAAWQVATPTTSGFTKESVKTGDWVSKTFQSIYASGSIWVGSTANLKISTSTIQTMGSALNLTPSSNQIGFIRDAGAQFALKYNFDNWGECITTYGSKAFSISGSADVRIKATDDLTLQADNNSIIMNIGGTTQTFTATQQTFQGAGEVSTTGDYTIDASNDIILDAAGHTIEFRDAGITNYNFTAAGNGNNTIFSMTSYDNGSNKYPYFILRRSAGTSASKTTVADGDILGVIQFQGYNDTSTGGFDQAANIKVTVDGTPGSSDVSDMPGRMQFSTSADGSSSPTERLRINSVGEVYAFDLSTNSGTNYMRYDTGDGEISYWTSTQNVKENIRDLELDYAPLLAMRPVMFDYKVAAGGTKNVAGFIAEEISLAHPPSAALGPDFSYDEDGAIAREMIEDENGELKQQKVKLSEDKVPISWDHAATVSYLVRIIQDMHARIETLENS